MREATAYLRFMHGFKDFWLSKGIAMDVIRDVNKNLLGRFEIYLTEQELRVVGKNVEKIEEF